MPNSIKTSLYDLFNKSYHQIADKNFTKIAVGANYNHYCFVNPDFNCIIYVM